MSVFDKDLITGRTKVETAIEVLKLHCAGKKVLCAFSGGKDSQCCYHLLKEAGIDFEAQYSITRFDPPELMQFVREQYPDVIFRRAYKHSLVYDIVHNGLPNRWARWCCDTKHVKTPGFDITVIGVRWAESARRAKMWRQFGIKSDRTAYVCPICNWSENEVWEYLNARNIPHCRLYDEGYKRIGCMVCPLVGDKIRKADAARYPKFVNMIKIACRKRFDYWQGRDWKNLKGREINKEYPRNDREAYAEEMTRVWLETGQTSKVAKNQKPHHEVCVFEGSGFSGFDGQTEEEENNA